MNEISEIIKAKTCCFTGHRNRDLPFNGDKNTMGMKFLVSTIQLAVEEAINIGYDTFISGMAEGVDLICAEMIYNLAANGRNINLICAVPYPEQSVRDIKDPRQRYVYNIIIKKYKSICISDHYHKDCYKMRNKFMIDNSSRIIGVMRSKKTGSGTLQTVNMAKKQGLDSHIIDLDSNPIYYIR